VGRAVYAYADGNPVSETDPLGLYGGAIAAGGRLGSYYNVAPIVQLRLPDYATFQLDAYVFSVSATYTVNGDIFLGKGANRAYPNPLSRGVSISAGWMLNPCGDGHPTRDQLNNFLNSWSAGAGGYAAFGGSVSANGSGKGFNLGVGVGNFGVTPGMINSYQGNVFGEPYP
jgi:hypothetical protein